MSTSNKNKDRQTFLEMWSFLYQETLPFLNDYPLEESNDVVQKSLIQELISSLRSKKARPTEWHGAWPLEQGYLKTLIEVSDVHGGGYKLSLGQRFRLFALYYVSNHKNRQSFAAIRNAGVGKLRSIQGALSYIDKRAFLRPEIYQALWRANCPDPFRHELARGNIGLSEFSLSPMTGEQALVTLIANLNCEQGWNQPFLTGRIFKHFPGDERQKLLEEIIDWTGRDDQQPMIFNVVDDAHPKGLSALGQAIALQYSQKFTAYGAGTVHRRPLYLPLMGDIVPIDEARSRRPIETSQLLGYLKAFYKDGLDAVTGSPAHPQTGSMATLVTELREAMVHRPQVLILDGLFQHSQMGTAQRTGSSVERLIADQQVLRLITQLVTPPIGSIKDQDDWNRWKSNRIIVLSDFRISRMGDTARYVPAKQIRERIGLAPPHRDHWPEILQAHGLKNREKIVEMTRYSEVTFRDIDYAVFDAILSVVEHSPSPKLIDGLQKKLAGEVEGLSTESLLRDLFLLVKDANPLAFSILFLISLSPDGIRRSTLFRLMWQMNESKSPHALLPLDVVNKMPTQEMRSDDIDGRQRRFRNDFDAALELLLKKMPAILYEGYHDESFDLTFSTTKPEVSLLQMSPHFTLATSDRWDADFAAMLREKPSIGAIAFSVPVFQRVARDVIGNDLAESKTFYAYRALADEAFWQAGAIFRQTDLQDSSSIRPWRRFISGIYFGLQSLPIERMADGKSITISESIDKDRNRVDLRGTASIGPRNHWQYWTWLYAFCYLQVLEARPQFRLSRTFGYEALKSELLAAFDKPYLLWNPTRTEKITSGLNQNLNGLFSETSSLLKQFDRIQSRSGKFALNEDATLGSRGALRTFVESRVLTTLAMDEVDHANDILETSFPADDLETAPQTTRTNILKFDLKLETLRVSLCSLRNLPGPIPNPKSLEDSLRLNSRRRKLSKPLQKTATALQALMVKDAEDCFALIRAGTGAGPVPSLSEQVQSTLREFDLKKSKDFAFVADTVKLLRRLGEYAFMLCRVLRCENSGKFFSEEPPTQQEFHEPVDMEQILVLVFEKTIDGTRPNHTLLLHSAMAFFRMSEALRMAVFDALPISDAYKIGARAARNHCRCLFMAHKQFVANGGNSATSPFLASARIYIDIISRHTYQYPAERAGNLILEACYFHLAVDDEHVAEALNLALHQLKYAEQLILEHGRDYQSRFPLYLERVKILHHKANLTESPTERKWLIELAESDLDRLNKIVQSKQPHKDLIKKTLPLKDGSPDYHGDKHNLYALLLHRESINNELLNSS